MGNLRMRECDSANVVIVEDMAITTIYLYGGKIENDLFCITTFNYLIIIIAFPHCRIIHIIARLLPIVSVNIAALLPLLYQNHPSGIRS